MHSIVHPELMYSWLSLYCISVRKHRKHRVNFKWKRLDLWKIFTRCTKQHYSILSPSSTLKLITSGPVRTGETITVINNSFRVHSGMWAFLRQTSKLWTYCWKCFMAEKELKKEKCNIKIILFKKCFLHSTCLSCLYKNFECFFCWRDMITAWYHES